MSGIFPRLICKHCQSTKFRPIAGVAGENSNAFCYRCMVCHEFAAFISSNKKLSTPDVIINIVDTIHDLNSQLQAQPMGDICPKCKTGKYKSVDVSESKRLRLDIIECGNCHFVAPVISIPREIVFAYSYDMELAEKVVKDFPEIALVFCISALETYFKQLFQYRSELNEYLIRSRRINFQNLSETKVILRKEIGIDIATLINKDWDFLCKKFQQRHGIIHSASYDKNGKKIVLSQKDIKRLFLIADDLVLKIEMAILNPNIFD